MARVTSVGNYCFALQMEVLPPRLVPIAVKALFLHLPQKNFFKNIQVRPMSKAFVNRVPFAIPFGNITPACSRTHYPQNTIESKAEIFKWSSSFFSRQQVFDFSPLCIGHFISTHIHHQLILYPLCVLIQHALAKRPTI